MLGTYPGHSVVENNIRFHGSNLANANGAGHEGVIYFGLVA